MHRVEERSGICISLDPVGVHVPELEAEPARQGGGALDLGHGALACAAAGQGGADDLWGSRDQVSGAEGRRCRGMHAEHLLQRDGMRPSPHSM